MAKTSKHSHANAHTSEDTAGLPLLVNAARLIGLRLDKFMAYEPFLASPDSVYELHEMRAAAKRLRYTMEIFQDAYTLYTNTGVEFAQSLEAVKAIQEHLGALHDADVLVPRLLEHLGTMLRDGYGTHTSENSSKKDRAPSASNRSGAKTHTADTVALPMGSKTANAQSPARNAFDPVAFDPAALDIEGRPIAGVHRVNYDACRGLLNLCTQTREGRDASYGQLLETWGAMQAAHQFDRLRDLLTGVEKEKTEEEKTEEENAVTAETLSGDSVVPALSLAAASSENIVKETLGDTSKDTFERTAGTAKETDAHDAANRQNAQVRRAPGEPGHVAAARRRANAERGGQSGSGPRGSGDRKPGGGKPEAEQAGEASEGTADAAADRAAEGTYVVRDARRAERADRSKNTRGKDARPRSAARRKDASRPA